MRVNFCGSFDMGVYVCPHIQADIQKLKLHILIENFLCSFIEI